MTQPQKRTNLASQKMKAMQEEINELKAKLAAASGDFVEGEDDFFHAKIFIGGETYPEWREDGYQSLEEARRAVLRAARSDSDIFGAETARFEIFVERDILALKGRILSSVTVSEE